LWNFHRDRAERPWVTWATKGLFNKATGDSKKPLPTKVSHGGHQHI
jgi:hypothetical protein